MEEKLSGLVLGGVNFGENDKILNIFTLENGVISAKIKGVKKARAKLKFAAEPFCFAQFIFAKTGKNRTVTGASLIESFYALREDLVKYYVGGTILEFVKRFIKEEDVEPEFFYLVINSLKQVAFGDEPAQLTLIKFLLSALKLIGYSLSLNGCFSCGKKIEGKIFFDYECGGFFCQECYHSQSAKQINLKTFESLRKVIDGDKLNKEDCLQPLRLLEFYIQNRTEEKITSLQELINIISD